MKIQLSNKYIIGYLKITNRILDIKVIKENHNLDRTRNQLKLASDIENNFDMMNEIVSKYI